MNPANQFGYPRRIFGFSTRGLITGTTSGKANFNYSDKPRFIEALIATIVLKPERVRCSRRSIISQTLINSSQSARFFVIRGYLFK